MINKDFFLLCCSQTYDYDTVSYIKRIEQADGQPLEPLVKGAIRTFIFNCKRDNIWNSIKNSCLMCGPKTIQGALVPLKGSAPLVYNFNSSNYNRKTGLESPSTSVSAYIDTRFDSKSVGLDNIHISTYSSVISSGTFGNVMGDITDSNSRMTLFRSSFGIGAYCRATNPDGYFSTGSDYVNKLLGITRSDSTSFTMRVSDANTSFARGSRATTTASNIYVYARNLNGVMNTPIANTRLKFYSCGEAIDLQKLENRLTQYINTISSLP